MKIFTVKFCFFVTVLMVFASACKKSDDNNAAPSSFTWTWNGNNYNGIFKEAYLESSGQSPTIIGGTVSSTFSTGSGPRLNISSFNLGNYSFGGTNNNNLYFITPTGDQLLAIAGNLTITGNANARISGNFTATLTNGTVQTSLSGAFVNITINP